MSKHLTRYDLQPIYDNLKAFNKRLSYLEGSNQMADTQSSKTNSITLNHLLWAMADNRKIEAIKYYRELTGLGLKESKDAVEKFNFYRGLKG